MVFRVPSAPPPLRPSAPLRLCVPASAPLRLRVPASILNKY
jgi:hypothetical protein